jgi:large subunit ribosomal protein L6
MEAKFSQFLKLVGSGFKARTEREGREMFLKLGYNHEVQFTAHPSSTSSASNLT